MFQWKRLPDADAAGQASNDTTETQIGTGFTIPNWTKSIRSIHTHFITLALTTDEDVAGYIKLVNDEGTIEPLNVPLPSAQTLAGAQGGHLSFPITFPTYFNVTPNDTLRAYIALDSATTGVHTVQCYVGLSSHPVPYNMHGQKSAVIAGSTTANTSAGTATLSTIANKVKQLLGCGIVMLPSGGVTADETCGGYVKITSNAKGWVEQRIPTPIHASGLGTDIEAICPPVISLPQSLLNECYGVTKIPWLEEFPCATKEDFTFVNYQDGTNSNAPAGRYFLYWRE